jgi:hypothetical protein
MVEGVLGQLRHTQTVLDDLDENLKVTICVHLVPSLKLHLPPHSL